MSAPAKSMQSKGMLQQKAGDKAHDKPGSQYNASKAGSWNLLGANTQNRQLLSYMVAIHDAKGVWQRTVRMKPGENLQTAFEFEYLLYILRTALNGVGGREASGRSSRSPLPCLQAHLCIYRQRWIAWTSGKYCRAVCSSSGSGQWASSSWQHRHCQPHCRGICQLDQQHKTASATRHHLVITQL